jgi:integrase
VSGYIPAEQNPRQFGPPLLTPMPALPPNYPHRAEWVRAFLRGDGLSYPQPAAAADGPTFGEIADRYFREVVEVRCTLHGVRSAKSALHAHLYPAWKDVPLRQIQRRDIKRLLMDIGTKRKNPYKHLLLGCPGQANWIHMFLRRFFNWCLEEEENLIDMSPIAGLQQPFHDGERERFLSDIEIKYFWQSAIEEGYPFGSIARMLLITGQRRGEIANAHKTQINRDTRLLTIPIRADKERRGHLVPLSDLALELLDELPHSISCPQLFTCNVTRQPIASNFYRANRRLNARMTELYRADITRDGGDPNEAFIEPWIFRDLRRTAATVMARIGQDLGVVDKILNHANGKSGFGRTINTVTRIHVKHEYLDKRHETLQALADYIKVLVAE